jgi:flagellar basal-body rod modification protein FlgD
LQARSTGWTSEHKATKETRKVINVNIQGISPLITAPLQAQSAKPAATTSSTTGTGSSSNTTGGLSSTNLESTFLNLLATELQNQDPTAPVDPTAMVGQLVSLNQLDQLISINQTLSSMTGTATSQTGTSQSSTTNPSNASSIVSGSTNTSSSLTPNISAIPSVLQPAYASTPSANALMNLYGSFSAPVQTQQLSPTGGR